MKYESCLNAPIVSSDLHFLDTSLSLSRNSVVCLIWSAIVVCLFTLALIQSAFCCPSFSRQKRATEVVSLFYYISKRVFCYCNERDSASFCQQSCHNFSASNIFQASLMSQLSLSWLLYFFPLGTEISWRIALPVSSSKRSVDSESLYKTCHVNLIWEMWLTWSWSVKPCMHAKIPAASFTRCSYFWRISSLVLSVGTCKL